MQEKKEAAAETRPLDTEIMASEAIPGYWYTVPSGEVERCHAIRERGRGVQVGFVGVASNANDPDDIRWLPGRAAVLVARNPAETGAVVNPDATSEADQPIEEGDLQAGGRGMTAEEIAKEYPEALRATLEGAVLNAATALTQEQLQRAAEALDSLKKRTNLAIMVGTEQGPKSVELEPRKAAGPSSVFHKSLHIDWRTPQALFDAQVARWGPYWLDAAATDKNKLCEYHLGPGADIENALSVDWEPTEEVVQQYGYNIWLNHPYSPGEDPCGPDCAKKKCRERGYHVDRRIASSGEWMVYARDQAITKALPFSGALTCLTKRAGETQWWKEAIRQQPSSVGAFVSGRSDPFGGPAAEFMNGTKYKAALWIELRWERLIVDIVEIEGRVDFDRGGNDGSAGFPSALVTFYRPGDR